MLENFKKYTQSKVFVGVAFFVASLLLILFISSLGSKAVKPEPDEEDIARETAMIFKAGELYKLLDENEKTVSLIQKDLDTFARTTNSKVADDDVIGFTFTKGPLQEGDSYVFEGLFYDVAGKIKLVIKKIKPGVVRLSITNQKTKENIDEKLQLNGPRSKLIETLPIEKNEYSIRHLFNTDEVVISFYDGFTINSLNEAVTLLKSAFGDTYKEDDFRFNINGVGTMTPIEIANYLQQNN